MSDLPPSPSRRRIGPERPPGTGNPAGGQRRIPPHGDLSPDGQRIWPRPSKCSRMIVWTGAAVMATAATAGTVLALRHIADRIAPRCASSSDQRDEQTAPPSRPQEPQAPRAAPNQPPRPKARVKAKPRKRPLVDEIEDTGHRLTATVGNVSSSLAAAVAGFARLALQSRGIVQDFSEVADMIRTTLATRQAEKQPERHPPDPAEKPRG